MFFKTYWKLWKTLRNFGNCLEPKSGTLVDHPAPKMGHRAFENHRMGHFLVIHRRKWDMGCLDTYKWDTGWPSSAENWTWES